MNSILKTCLLAAILGRLLLPKPGFGETSSGKLADQSDAKASAATDASDTRRTKDPASAQGYGGHSTPPDPKAADADHPVTDSTNAQPKDSTDAHPRAALQGPALFKLIDTNKDGRISLDEYVAYGKAANPSTASRKTSPDGGAHNDSASASASSKAGAKSDAPKTASSDKKTNAVPEPDSPGPSLLPSVSTRADKFTAEVFANLDIDHDKFLSQAELDALIGAHQISQP